MVSDHVPYLYTNNQFEIIQEHEILNKFFSRHLLFKEQCLTHPLMFIFKTEYKRFNVTSSCFVLRFTIVELRRFMTGLTLSSFH